MPHTLYRVFGAHLSMTYLFTLFSASATAIIRISNLFVHLVKIVLYLPYILRGSGTVVPLNLV